VALTIFGLSPGDWRAFKEYRACMGGEGSEQSVGFGVWPEWTANRAGY